MAGGCSFGQEDTRERACGAHGLAAPPCHSAPSIALRTAVDPRLLLVLCLLWVALYLFVEPRTLYCPLPTPLHAAPWTGGWRPCSRCCIASWRHRAGRSRPWSGPSWRSWRPSSEREEQRTGVHGAGSAVRAAPPAGGAGGAQGLRAWPRSGRRCCHTQSATHTVVAPAAAARPLMTLPPPPPGRCTSPWSAPRRTGCWTPCWAARSAASATPRLRSWTR